MWAEYIKYIYREISDSFLNQLNLQLNEEFKHLVGYSIPEKKTVLHPEEAVKNDTKTMSSSFKTLVIIVVEGIDAKIAWKNLKGDTFIKVSDEVTEEDIKFWWEELDMERMKIALQAYAEPVKFPFAIKKKRFKITYYQTFDSEMIFTFSFSEQETTKKEIEEGIDKIVEEWNNSSISSEDERMQIEYFVNNNLQLSNKIQFSFDFRDAIIDGLEFVVKKINESSLPIKSLKIEPI